jgi:Gluconate 2-dehydrogenase subunit 3
VTRRELLAWAGASGATFGCRASTDGATIPPVPSPTSPPRPPAPPYFTSEQRSVLEAVADAILPPDDTPGGAELGAVDYIENLLTAFEPSAPLIFSGGPYSGRQPLPNTDGSPSTKFPSDGLSTFLPLDRVADRAWRLRIYGSSGVVGGGPNDAITGPIVGLRSAVASAIQQAKAAAPANVSLDSLTPAEEIVMLAAIDPTTQATIIELVLEGAFTNPEYGGNKNRAGWAMTYFGGDSQPYGYSTYDGTTDQYIDHPESPCASADPGPDPMPMDASTELLVGSAFVVLGGKTFG